jgi:basic membrane lipoprotein Med (substrate-binding protein (PBP1-ABC) superfamily)
MKKLLAALSAVTIVGSSAAKRLSLADMIPTKQFIWLLIQEKINDKSFNESGLQCWK